MKEEIKKIRIEDYDYHLPEERIARFPLTERDRSKLLIAGADNFSNTVFRQLPGCLPEDSLLIFNETKVIQARLLFPRTEKSSIEIFCLQPWEGWDIERAMAKKDSIEYECLVGGAKKWKSGELCIELDQHIVLRAEKGERQEGTFRIRFSWNGGYTFAEILEKAGKTPLPPYLKREAIEDDKLRYQTIFARNNGSVAAPTASLHFTEEVIAGLAEKGISQAKLTLHVGAGTFKPVDSEEIGEHNMHAEEVLVSRSFVQYVLDNIQRKIIPVGTTAMRALESIYWLGCLASEGKIRDNHLLDIPQWLPYEWDQAPAPAESFKQLLSFMEQNERESLRVRTSVIIAPGYEHRLCHGLITNFHQPRSTLLLLVASLLGERWRDMYRYAMENDFRFLSYGDAALILRS